MCPLPAAVSLGVGAPEDAWARAWCQSEPLGSLGAQAGIHWHPPCPSLPLHGAHPSLGPHPLVTAEHLPQDLPPQAVEMGVALPSLHVILDSNNLPKRPRFLSPAGLRASPCTRVSLLRSQLSGALHVPPWRAWRLWPPPRHERPPCQHKAHSSALPHPKGGHRPLTEPGPPGPRAHQALGDRGTARLRRHDFEGALS